MLYSWRGVGKTHVSLSMAYAIASGGKLLRFSAPRPRRVVYVDGEMPLSTMQERLANIVAGSHATPPSPDYFKILTPDAQEVSIPNLSLPMAQRLLTAGFPMLVYNRDINKAQALSSLGADVARDPAGLHRNGQSLKHRFVGH